MSKVHGRAGLALGLLFAINTLNFYDRHILATVTEPIRKQYGFTDTQMGWLGTAFIWSWPFWSTASNKGTVLPTAGPGRDRLLRDQGGTDC